MQVTFRVTIDRAHLKKELMGIRVTYKSLWDSLSKAEKEAALKGTPAKPATPSAGADPKAPPKGAAGPVAESLDKDSSTEIEEVFITADPALDRMRAREDEGGAPTGPQNNVGDRIDLGHSKMKTEAVGDVTWALDLAEVRG